MSDYAKDISAKASRVSLLPDDALKSRLPAQALATEAQDRPEFVLIDSNGNEINRKPALTSKWGWYADINSKNVAAIAFVQPARKELNEQ